MFRNILSVLFSLTVLVGLGTGCGSSKKTAADETSMPHQILLVSGTISYDSVKASYDMTVSSQLKADGVLNLETGPVSESDVLGLNYVQLDRKDKTLSIHKMDNPLVQQMEYHDGDRMGRMTVRLKEVVYNIRIPLDPHARKILFRNGDTAIMTLEVK